MGRIFFRFGKTTPDEWDFIEKALSHKYIKRIPTGKPDRPWYYIYAETFLKPFKALAEIFGVTERRVNDDYDNENIKKNYGVDKKTFAAHILEYFTNREKWNKIFGTRENREKYKKPVKQSEFAEAITKQTGKKPSEKKRIINRSLMKKVWSLYSPTAKQIENKEALNGTDNQYNAEPRGISERDSSVWNGSGNGGGSNGTENGDSKSDGNGIELDSSELGERLGGTEASVKLRPGRGVPGRQLTKGETKALREQIKNLLASKKDEEFTEADKEILRKYEGAGGLGEADATNAGVLNEYYTPVSVVNKVWELVDKYNPRQDKRVIEPSAGSGRFAEGRSEKFTMFELDETSSRINRILHPDAEIHTGYFQENFMNGGMFAKKEFEKFDVAIGNPPYGKYEGLHKGRGEGKEHSKIDEYFIDRSLDTLKDGGILAMVVPSSFLKSKNSKVKEKLEKKGKLLEAWRLPNGTFSTTGVGTDIIIIQKGMGEQGALSNDDYFLKNPNCIVGTETERTGRFGKLEKYVALNPGENFGEAIEKIKTDTIAIDRDEIPQVEIEIKKKPDWVGKTITVNRKTGRITQTDKDGNTTVLEEGRKETEEEKKKNRSDAMRGNKNAEGSHDVQKIAGTLMSSEQFDAKYNKNIPKEELEIWKSTDIDGLVNIHALDSEMIKYVQTSGSYVIDKAGNWTHIANWQSGNIVQKLEQLEADYPDKNDKNYLYKKQLLEDVLPGQKKIEQLDLSPIENWVRDYKVEVNGQRISLIDAFYLWAYNGHGYYDRNNSPITPYEIPAAISWNDISDYMRKVPVKAERVGKNASKDDRNFAQKQAQKKRDLRRQTAEKLFNRFLKDGLNKENAEKLCKDWNRQFNSYVNPDYRKIPIRVDGMCTHKGSKEFTLLDQQVKGISFLVNKGSGILAYDVGVGKTAAGIVATVNQLQTGRSKKPLICVPKAVYKKWIKEIHEHFPGQEVFELGNLTEQYFKPGDAIPEGVITVCAYEALEKMTFKDETIEEITEDAEYNAINPYNNKKKTRRDVENDKNKIGTLVGEMTKTTGQNSCYFEDLGFDHITVDEVHNFKNIFALPRNYKLGKDDDDDDENGKREANEFSKIRGSSSDRGKKMFAITQYLQRHNGNRNVYALSATPFTNSPTEIYSMLSLVARHRLRKLGIYSLHEFLAKFAELKTEYVIKPDNSVVEEQVVKSFKKLQALQNLITEYIDKVDGDEAGVIRPHKVTHTPELEMTDLQKQMIQEQIDYMSNASSKEDPAATIVAMNNMRMITLAPAIVDPALLDQFVESSPKLKFVCDSIIGQWKKNPKNGQVMYMPRGVKYFDKVVDYLVKHGMPRDAIGIMAGGASTEKELDKREALKNDFNNVDGKCKVIIGSGTIQEGVSLNGNATTIYNCMLGWNPSETTQVEGRIWRQGNRQGVTHIVYPLMNDSIDALMYQKYDEKQSRIDELWKYKGDTLNVADIDPEELKFGLIKDPEKRADLQIIQEKEMLEDSVRQLGMQVDILHKNAKLAFDTDIERECMSNRDYSRAKDELKEGSNFNQNMEWFRNQKERWEKIHKIVSKLPKDCDFSSTDVFNDVSEKTRNELEMDRYALIDMRGGYWQEKTTMKEALANIDKRIKEFDEKYKNAKQTKVSYERIVRNEEKRVKDLVESARETLKRQNLDGLAACEEKIERLNNDRISKQGELAKMKDKREEYKQKAIEDIKRSQKKLPSLDEITRRNVDSITSQLRTMDEIKAIIKENRTKGVADKDTKEQIDKMIGVKKSWCYFKKDGRGNMRFYIRKSVVANLR